MMLKKFIIVAIGCLGCAAVVGLAQAKPVQLAPVANYKGDTSWQDIAGTSYTFKDTNHDGKVNVGETVTFTVDMHKTYWGTHAYDALKFWIDGKNISGTYGNLYTNKGTWVYDSTKENLKWFNKPGDPYSWKHWTGGDKLFTFNYTFKTVGVFDIVASVMCSRDLSGLVGSADDKPTSADWNAWSESIHTQTGWRQGETERYKFTVVASPIPEPQTYAMLLVGLGLIGFMVRRRKSLES